MAEPLSSSNLGAGDAGGAARTLDYVSGPKVWGEGPIVEVLPDGVILDVGMPSATKAFLQAVMFTGGAIGFGASAVSIALDLLRGSVTFGSFAHLFFWALISLLWAVGATSHWSFFGQVLRREPRLSWLRINAADAEDDPVKVIRAQLGRVEFHLRRVPELYVKTDWGNAHRLYRGRSLDELRLLERELKSLLRLEDEPVKGFPVVPVGMEPQS